MTVIASIDGVNRDIYLHADTVGVDLEPMDIYKEMRTLRRTNEELRKFDLFLSAHGKDPKGSGKFTERYVKELKGTRIIPFDVTQVLNVVGTIITDDGQEGIACFDRTPLTPTTRVDINYVPLQVEVIEINTGSGITEQDKNDIRDKVWNDTGEQLEGTKGSTVDHLKHLQYHLFINTEANDDGDGSQHNPFNNETSAIDYAEVHGIKSLFLQSELITSRNIKNFSIAGIGLQKVEANGHDFKNTQFDHVLLEGQYVGAIIGENCYLSGVNTTLNGQFGNCTLSGTFIVPDGGDALIQHSSSKGDGFIKPTFDVGGVTGTAVLEFAGHVGGITVLNCNQPTDEVRFLGDGIVEIDSSCTDGNIVVIGNVKPIDNSGAGCTVQWLNIDPDKLSNIPSDVWNHTQ